MKLDRFHCQSEWKETWLDNGTQGKKDTTVLFGQIPNLFAHSTAHLGGEQEVRMKAWKSVLMEGCVQIKRIPLDSDVLRSVS